LPEVFRRAAYIIQGNGHHQGDYVPDPMKRNPPRETRPMSVCAALWCAADPNRLMFESDLASAAIRHLAGRLLVDGEGPWNPGRTVDCATHVSRWEDVPGRTGGEVIRLLLDAAQSVAGRVLVPTQVVLAREVAA
jgi:hypothetical protein